MKITYQYRIAPETQQKLELNSWLRICQYWYNRLLGERFDWYQNNRCSINACPLVCSLYPLKDRPNYYNQKSQLPNLKDDLILVGNSKKLLDFTRVYSTVLQNVCKRVDMAFERFIAGDSNGKYSGKPRFKGASRYRTLQFDGAQNRWLKFCTINGKWLFIQIPKIGLVKIRTHRPLPDGFNLKQVSLTKKPDGWYISLVLEDKIVPEFNPDVIIPTWNNSLGLDAVLNEDVFLATSEGETLPSLKPLRKSQARLTKVSQKKNKRKKGSKARRKLASKEGKIHQQIARERKDFHYKTAHKLVRTEKKIFFVEDLNLVGLSKRNKAKQDDDGKYLTNGQASKSGLNKSWMDAGFGNFFNILGNIAEKAGAKVEFIKPNYTSQLLSYRDEFIFTNRSIREYWDEKEKLNVDRDINASVNIKRVGLDVFPTFKKRRSGNPVIIKSITNSTAKEVLSVLRGTREARA
jgi:putative transposase